MRRTTKASAGPLATAIAALRKRGHIVEDTVPPGRFLLDGNVLTALQMIALGAPECLPKLR